MNITKAKEFAIPDVSCRYGSPMGRGPLGTEPRGEVFVFPVRLVDGGCYDMGGAYWGARRRGESLYCVTDGKEFRRFVDARSVAEARDLVRDDAGDEGMPFSPWASRCYGRIIAAAEGGEPLTESDTRKMRAILKRALSTYYREPSPHASVAEACYLVDAIETLQPKITLSQASRGAEFVIASTLTARGELRATAWARSLLPADVQVIRAAREGHNLERAALVGLEAFEESGGYVSNLLPVYRMHGAGRWIDYAAASWQSGIADRLSIIRRG